MEVYAESLQFLVTAVFLKTILKLFSLLASCVCDIPAIYELQTIRNSHSHTYHPIHILESILHSYLAAPACFKALEKMAAPPHVS